ncbi:putative sterigmatocystin biosynthesis peroxidase stcC [Colletotrichum sp. SAR 10_70]|nr:putative sterigmatocystin biosynthesis peroxidase stcC [Colletotrichum sp. SAR 10_71]KAI8191679.1 putative sterigmatocystin biosynthesis peroxidase stcC [Colletotrichum sp. SAR 10_75]KAI8194195.1 putative sterigmatocystin biosynthesis peroxidase stcC [Colletotrichum sp. SAR 10_70]KAI8199343.1 putative sterigmatocystin biosynthesis peroxidase stcC [Colletotrichum sp. SAR 10_65]KAI8214371.1 putative sterigmatocystin biosynthesis peroxidase stcC [Colletotrichum sp. SAR 10_76]KAI8232706.1 putat
MLGSRLMFLQACMASVGVLATLTEDLYPWQPPQPGDLRSPCPGINALANHGLLPRDGRDIDLDVLGAATALGFNMDHETMLLVGIPALKTSTTGNASTFHLSDVNQHMPQVIEHDGSLTRDDAYFGDSLHFSPAAWGRTLAGWGDVDIIDFAAAAREIKARFEWGEKFNPEFNATFARSGSLLQYALLLSAFGDYGDANKTLVRYWVENERLPLSLGWQPPTKPIIHDMNALIAANISALWDAESSSNTTKRDFQYLGH